MQKNLTQGPITKTLVIFALPMIGGNMLQQLYNIADTLIVGRFIGSGALAAVGSSYTLMTFLTSILLGLCMGSGAVFSIRYGEGDMEKLHESLGASFVLILAVAAALNLAVFLLIDPIMYLLQVPGEIYDMMRQYLWVIFWGILATFLYNYFACLLRAVGKFCGAADLPGGIFCNEYCPGSVVCPGLSLGSGRCGFCHSAVPVRVRDRPGNLHLLENAGISYTAEISEAETGYAKGDRTVFFSDLRSAVGDESGNPDGPGTGEQFRHSDYGSFCGGGED